MKELYYKNSNYNQVRILNKLYDIILENGGSLVNDLPYINTYHQTKIYNRTPKEIILVNEELIKKAMENNIQNEFVNKKISEYEEAKKHKGEYVISPFTSYIRFVLNDDIYYFQFDTNTFFPYYKMKEKSEIKNNCYFVKYYHYMEEVPEEVKDNINNNIYNFMTDEEIEQQANNIFNYLINSEYNEVAGVNKKEYRIIKEMY